MDVISEYSFAKPYGLLEKPELGLEWVEIIMSASAQSHLIKQFGWLFPMMKAMPEWLVAMTNPGVMCLINLQKVRLDSYIMK
jgi:hypothetical protein